MASLHNWSDHGDRLCSRKLTVEAFGEIMTHRDLPLVTHRDITIIFLLGVMLLS